MVAFESQPRTFELSIRYATKSRRSVCHVPPIHERRTRTHRCVSRIYFCIHTHTLARDFRSKCQQRSCTATQRNTHEEHVVSCRTHSYTLRRYTHTHTKKNVLRHARTLFSFCVRRDAARAFRAFHKRARVRYYPCAARAIRRRRGSAKAANRAPQQPQFLL